MRSASRMATFIGPVWACCIAIRKAVPGPICLDRTHVPSERTLFAVLVNLLLTVPYETIVRWPDEP